jgi:hypothetical protein
MCETPELERTYVLVEGDGEILRTVEMSDEEAATTNKLFASIGIERRWMQKGE